jgi:hypothetical protein
MKLAWLVPAVAFVCACENRETVKASTLPEDHKPKPTDMAEIQKLIEDGLLTLDLNFRKTHYLDDQVLIECVASLANHSRDELVLERDLFAHYENYRIEDSSTGGLVDDFADSSGKSPDRYFTLADFEQEEFSIKYEAFVCFQGVRYGDGRVEYKPSGTFVIYHRMFPGNKTTFEFTEGGVILQLIDMKEQDE